MYYDKKTMTIRGLTIPDKEELLEICKKMVYKGHVDFENRFVKFWLDNTTHDDGHRLLLAGTAMPQRLLLSVMED